MAITHVSCVIVAVLFLNLVFVAPKHVPIKVGEAPEIYPFDFFSRADWGAKPSTDKRPLDQPVPYVVVHHTYIPAACFTLKKCASDMRAMQKYHKSLGWGDIGYNFCVGAEGGAYEGRGWDNIGIHAGPANSFSIGICLFGDYRVQLPLKAQIDTLKGLIKAGVMLGKIKADHKLIGHRQVMTTECPGDALLAEISTWDHYEYGMPDFSALTTVATTATTTVLPDEKHDAED